MTPGLRPIARQSARALPVSDDGRLLLIRRVRPGLPPYWTTAGGGIEPGDPSAEAAMHRELFEELGATAAGASQVLLVSSVFRTGLTVQRFFVTRLVSLDLSARTGTEVSDKARGTYDPGYFDLHSRFLSRSLLCADIRPPELGPFILANREAILAEAARFSPGA
jgi:8-oxo-dGTP pyrophosphatase MutT (NUDIX family)